MRVLSLFSGVGGLCSLGLGAAGHDVVGLCEIDDKARSVLRHHHPDTPIWEDVTNVQRCACQTSLEDHHAPVRSVAVTDGELGLPDPVATGGVVRCPDCEGVPRGRVDLVAGGSPCQDLSVAGRRAGLDGGRSGLFWHQCRIADELAAPWVVWENVAGAFSSNDGADFAAVLWGLTGTLPDVPDGGWKSCGVVVGPKRAAVWRLLDAQWFGVAQRRRRVFVVAGPRGLCRPEVFALGESVSGHPRPSREARQEPAAIAGYGIGEDGEHVAGSLGLTHFGDDIDRHGAHFVTSFNWQGSAEQGADVQTEYTWSLGCTRHTAVAFAIRGRDGASEIELGEPEVYNSLRAGDGGSSRQNGLLTPDLAVRRLTPRECERLMGWPDDHTRWADDGTEIADSHRYRMCGNGVVAPVARWIGERLMEAAA